MAKKNTPSKKTLEAVADRPALVRLVKLLAREPVTARAIMAKTGCSKPTVYARIAALVRAGVTVKTSKVRDGATGPLADAFSL